MALSDRLYGKTKVPVKTFDFKEQIKKSVQSTQSPQPKKTPTPQPQLTAKQIADLQKQKQTKQADIEKKAKKDKADKLYKANFGTPSTPYGTKGNLKDSKGKNLPRVVNPVATGITTVVTGRTAEFLPGFKNAQKQSKEQFPKSYIAGQILGYGMPSGIATGITKGLVKGATKKITGDISKRVVEGAIIGTTAEATQIVKPLITKEITPEQATKQLATGLVAGAKIDVALGVLGKVLKALPKDTISKIKSGITLNSSEKNNIIKELGLPKGTTADDYIRQMQDLAKSEDIINIPKQREADQVEQYYKSLEKEAPTQQQIVKPIITQEQSLIKPITQSTERPTAIVKPLIEPTVAPQIKTPVIEPQGVKSVAESFDVPKTESLNVPLREPLIPTANKIKDDGLGTAEQLRERIVSDVKKPKKSFDEFWKKAESQFIDDTAPLKHLEKKIKGKVSSAEESIYKTAGLYRGAPERASEIVRTGIKPAIQIAENAGFDHKDLRDYAIAVHAKEVNEAGINSGISTSSADDTIRKFGTPEMEAARQQLIKVSNKLVDDMFENGLITKESYEGLKNKWKNYMPLFREFDDNQVPKAFGMSDKLSGASAPIKGLVGSERKVIDPLQGMIKNIYATENAIARNKVGLQLAKLSDIDVENRFIRKLDNGEEVGRKNVVNVMIDGKKVGYEVEPEVYKMLQGLDKETSNWIISIMSKPASVLRAGATLTPEFALRNPMRDVMNAYVISKSGFNPIIDFPRGLASVMKKDEYYEQFLKENGGFGNIFSMDRQSHKDALEKIIKQPNSKKFVNILNPNSYIELLRSVSDVTESATKVGEFRKALSKGETPQEAAYRARNLMDFGKAGSSIRPANKVVAFLNANIRGKATLIEAIKENPVKVTGKLMASMVLPTVAFKSYNNEYANENQKQTIKDAPQWLKDTFWLVAVPGTDTVARIPKPFDIAAVANGTDRFIDYVVDNDKEAFDGFAKNTIKGSSIPVMMTGVLPILEAMSNYSQFKQGPIIPEREKFLPRKYQSDSKTSELAKIVAGGIGKVVGEESNFSSPRTIDYVIRSSTGGLGSTALDAADWVAKSTGLVKKPPKPSVGITGLPIVKGFTVSELSSGKSVGDLYDLKNKLTTEKGGLKFEAKKSNKDPKKVKYENEETYKFVNDITDEISDISKEMRDVTEDMNMSPEEKRVKLKELNDKRNKLSYEALTKAKKMLDKNNR